MNNFTPVSAAVGGALIGLSAVLLMLFTGRIAGVSGIFDGIINPQTNDRAWRAAFIAGLIAAPVTAVLVGYPVPMPQMPGNYITIVVGGLLVGFGARLGSGRRSVIIVELADRRFYVRVAEAAIVNEQLEMVPHSALA